MSTAFLQNLPKKHNRLTFEKLLTRNKNIKKSNSILTPKKSFIVTIGKHWELQINSIKLKETYASTFLRLLMIAGERILLEYSSLGKRTWLVTVDKFSYKIYSRVSVQTSWIVAIIFSHIKNTIVFPINFNLKNFYKGIPWVFSMSKV